jgi:hypothetical protein
MSNREYNFFNTVECSQRRQGDTVWLIKNIMTSLNKGVDMWNQWRKEHPEIQPDLSGLELTQASLSSTQIIEGKKPSFDCFRNTK